ncbi:MAG: hypothetical protein ACSHX5_04030 [Phycisphaerales bacterium]
MKRTQADQEFRASVLVSGEGLVATFEGMREKCHFIDLLDFCVLAEAIVLNDQIEIVCEIEYAHALSQHSIISTLQDAGVVSTITSHREVPSGESSNTVRGPNHPLTSYGSSRFKLKGNSIERREPLGTMSLDQVMDEATGLIRAERALGVSALPMRRFASLYVPGAKMREEHTVCDLMGRYRDLSEGIRQTRENTRYPIAPFAVAEIPPIPITVLERARDGEDILRRILEIRQDYCPLRESLNALRAELNDEDVPPAEKTRIIDGWMKSWSTLNKYGVGSSIQIGNTSSDLIDVDRSVDAETIDFKLSKVLELLLDKTRSGLRRWRVRMLHRTAEQYLQLSDGQIHRDLRRIYKKEFGSNDLRDLRDWEEMISFMTIDLEATSPKQEYVIERSDGSGAQ